MYQLSGLKRFPELVCACSDKSDGNMSFRLGEKEEILRNKKKFLSNLGIRQEDSVAMLLKHGTEIAFVDESSRGEEAVAVDCLMTKSRDLFLFVLTADCLPIVFYDPIQKLAGLAHVSRINAPLGFVRKIVEHFAQEGSRLEDIFVAIGPGVRKESYIFSKDELAERITGDEWEDFIVNLSDGRAGVDLVGYNVRGLVSAGVLSEHIEISDVDTIASKNFFSHYRSMKTGEKEGRMATVVGFVK